MSDAYTSDCARMQASADLADWLESHGYESLEDAQADAADMRNDQEKEKEL